MPRTILFVRRSENSIYEQWSWKNEANCHASASVRSEMHASNNLSHETICELNLPAMAATMKQQKLKIQF